MFFLKNFFGKKNFTASDTVRDVVIGMSDGLTVPFALAAGLSGAVDASNIIITAGLAEVAAGAIAMGLGGYLAARTDAEHFATERAIEEQETIDIPEVESEEVAAIFRSYGLPEPTVQQVVGAIRSDRGRWVDFMMRFELGLEEPDPRRAGRSALTIAGSYVVGGLIPLAPYFFVQPVRKRTPWPPPLEPSSPGGWGVATRKNHKKTKPPTHGKKKGGGGWGRGGPLPPQH